MKQEKSQSRNFGKLLTPADSTAHTRQQTPFNEALQPSSEELDGDGETPTETPIHTSSEEDWEGQSTPEFQPPEDLRATNEYHESFEAPPPSPPSTSASAETSSSEAKSNETQSSTDSQDSDRTSYLVPRDPRVHRGLTDTLFINANKGRPLGTRYTGIERGQEREARHYKTEFSTDSQEARPYDTEGSTDSREARLYETKSSIALQETDTSEDMTDREHPFLPPTLRTRLMAGLKNDKLNKARLQSLLSVQDVDGEQECETPPVADRLPVSHRLPVRPLEEANILANYGPADERLFLFDYDGTLTDIVQDPNRAIIPDVLYGWLRTLALEPKNTVWVISGRDQTFLQARLGKLTEIGLVAEHGAFMRRPGSSDWENLAAKADMSWKSTVRKHFKAFEVATWGAYMEEKKVAIVLHYRLAHQQDLVAVEVAACKDALERELENWPVEIINGKCVLEARPANVDKGRIVQRIMDEMKQQTGGPPDFVLCIGDDTTDEDMFRTLGASKLRKETVFTVTIGESTKASDADFYLAEPTDVFATITMLNSCDEAGDIEGLGPLQSDGTHRGSRIFPVPRSYLILD